ncbi:hypothetical protein SLEP1_g4667 [Rubroshorea leprosula]|uniref:Uncharacterized protein n=1 Tax=Rubroshorea leprosula TaxID=152421 RepID=A0AAV5HXJ9_9ROSI|nr:hypothetical protein SLEP1_g4667 [Rubroshorea leprosula]
MSEPIQQEMQSNPSLAIPLVSPDRKYGGTNQNTLIDRSTAIIQSANLNDTSYYAA